MVATLDYARKRVAAIIEEIDDLKGSEFPYRQSFDALDILESIFKDQQGVLNKISPTASTSVTQNACSISLYQLQLYLPILGFILRSTDVRNAFEAYGPLLRLVQNILEIDTKLIVSSEWEFSPFVYRSMEDLPGFVLIGLPAPESSNPLLLPLAGHELGHAVWESERLSGNIRDLSGKIETGVLDVLTDKLWEDYHKINPQFKKEQLRNGDLFAARTWMPAFTWALLQVEEIFCDFIGLRLFAESFLHAFEYLISPGIADEPRSGGYPNLQRRVSHLVKAANSKGVLVPIDFESGFIAQKEPSDPGTKLLVSAADFVSDSLIPSLIDKAWEFVDSKSVPMRNVDKVSHISEEFRKKIVPTTISQSFTDLLNAGWACYMDRKLWDNFPQIMQKDRDRILGDLILKSMEVSEIHKRLGNPS